MVDRFNVYGQLLDDHAPNHAAHFVRLADYDALAAQLSEAKRLLLKFHTGGPMTIAGLIDEVPEFLGIKKS